MTSSIPCPENPTDAMDCEPVEVPLVVSFHYTQHTICQNVDLWKKPKRGKIKDSFSFYLQSPPFLKR